MVALFGGPDSWRLDLSDLISQVGILITNLWAFDLFIFLLYFG